MFSFYPFVRAATLITSSCLFLVAVAQLSACERSSSAGSKTPANEEAAQTVASSNGVADVTTPAAADTATTPADPGAEIGPPSGKIKACEADSDCQTVANYCGGCACEGLLTEGQSAPSCKNPVQCLVDPCVGKIAVCRLGKCEAASGAQ